MSSLKFAPSARCLCCYRRPSTSLRPTLNWESRCQRPSSTRQSRPSKQPLGDKLPDNRKPWPGTGSLSKLSQNRCSLTRCAPSLQAGKDHFCCGVLTVLWPWTSLGASHPFLPALAMQPSVLHTLETCSEKGRRAVKAPSQVYATPASQNDVLVQSGIDHEAQSSCRPELSLQQVKAIPRCRVLQRCLTGPTTKSGFIADAALRRVLRGRRPARDLISCRSFCCG